MREEDALDMLGKLGRQASRRAGLTTIDQAISSLSNFAVGVAVARVGGEAGLGAFSLAYALWLALGSVHRALVVEPMAIEGDARDADDCAGAQRGLAAELILGLAAGAAVGAAGCVLVLSGAHTFGIALIAVAPWLPTLVVQDFWRWVGFMQAQPRHAVTNDSLFAAAQAAAFTLLIVAHVHSSALVIGSWGVGGLVGAMWGFRQFKVVPSLRGGSSLLRERWRLSKWLMANSGTVWVQGQAYVFFLGAMMGPAVVGGVKAAQTLVQGPSMVLIQATGSIGLPEASKAYDERGWLGLRRVSALITGAGFVILGFFGAVVVVAGGPLLRALYGRGFDAYAPAAALFALAYLASALGMGSTIVLKATRQTAYLFYVSLVQLLVFLVAIVILLPKTKANGAPLATLVTMLVYDVVVLYFRRRTVGAMPGEAPPTGEAPGRANSTVRPRAGALELALRPAPSVNEL